MTSRSAARERARKRLIFALDVGSLREASEYVRALSDSVGMFKVGKQLFLSTGPRIIEYVRDHGGEVFLDLKFHDIPQTVARASAEATRLGVAMFNVHASGSSEMMKQAVAAVRRVSRTEKLRRPKLLAVTVLTNLSADDLAQQGSSLAPADLVLKRAELAYAAGFDGVIASGQEAARIRAATGPKFLIVTPGIRLPGGTTDDQERVMTPDHAIMAGANYIVVGRPITQADDPKLAAETFVHHIGEALAKAGAAPSGPH